MMCMCDVYDGEENVVANVWYVIPHVYYHLLDICLLTIIKKHKRQVIHQPQPFRFYFLSK